MSFEIFPSAIFNKKWGKGRVYSILLSYGISCEQITDAYTNELWLVVNLVFPHVTKEISTF